MVPASSRQISVTHRTSKSISNFSKTILKANGITDALQFLVTTCDLTLVRPSERETSFVPPGKNGSKPNDNHPLPTFLVASCPYPSLTSSPGTASCSHRTSPFAETDATDTSFSLMWATRSETLVAGANKHFLLQNFPLQACYFYFTSQPALDPLCLGSVV